MDSNNWFDQLDLNLAWQKGAFMRNFGRSQCEVGHLFPWLFVSDVTEDDCIP